ncbi:MAG: UvrD-helicase domain-containing protein [Verrucomicrobia bacterium]|nr:UvrD-helicase domain-containing protein [Verrucomicrobiota bacterium]
MSDLTQQQAAAVNGHGNLLVVAGAGTGKTHTLIARCLRLLVADRVSLENILMVTFTEAAAAEMRGRLRKELQQLQEAQPEEVHLAQQLALLDTARISTLHGFCLQLAREHFHDLGLDPQFSILDEQQTRPLQRETLDEVLERHYAGTSAESLAVQALIRASGRGMDRRIRKLILKLHAYSQSLPDPATWLAAQQARFETRAPTEWRRLFVQAVVAWRAEWKTALTAVADETPALRLSHAALAALAVQPTLDQCATTLQAVAAADADPNWPHGTKGKFRDPLTGFFEDAEFLVALAPNGDDDPLQQDWEWSRPPMLALIGLAREFTLLFAAKKRELGGVDFPDLEQGALRLLREPAIAAEWRTRLAHVFVDEYQDINAAQDAILTALSRYGAAANRFLVGDVKQSIYRFRLANPQIFQRYHDEWSAPAGRDTPGAAGRALSLTENFRSREGLLRFVNPLFAALMRKEIGGVDYEPLEFGAREQRAARGAGDHPGPGVEFHLIAQFEAETPTGDEEMAEAANGKTEPPDLLAVEREARLVARRLRALHDAGHAIWDKDTGSFRPVKWGDMAVLLRSPAGRAEAFAKEFSKTGVPLCAARDGFFASLEVSDLLNLLKLLDNPLQDVPLLAVLRSPLVGLSLAELAEIRAGSNAKMFWTALQQMTNDESRRMNELGQKLKVFLDQFARWRELVRQTSLSQCLETALADTHYEAMLQAGERGLERAANVRRLLDLARQFDPYQRQGLYRFLRFVRMQEDEDLDLQPASPAAENAVRLLSIHKSKGLEFPVVVLAGMGTRFNEQDLSEAVLLDETMGLCPKITPPESEQSYPGLTHWLARRHERRELRGEELRLGYVALTRARDHLILVGTTKRKADAVKWGRPASANISTGEVANARSLLDWLLLWLPHATAQGDWTAERSGANDLLHWQIYDGSERVFQETGGRDSTPPRAESTDEPVPADAWDQLHSRLSWAYPFPAATTAAAKTSVTALRRRAMEDDVLEAEDWSRESADRRLPAAVRGPRTRRGKLGATEIGLAHHLFLEHVALDQTATESALRAEAERLRAAGLLATEQMVALDFAALANFWQSEIGRRICAEARNVKRELAFTARFDLVELGALLRSGPARSAPPAPDEFVVVQGVADLVVRLPEEIWLVDFKTDAVTPAELPAKVDHYGPQLKLYTLALARIYQRPVTECHLHFLTANKTVRVEPPTATKPV